MKKPALYAIGSEIQWNWMGRSITGIVKEAFFEPVSKKIKDKTIKRNGSKENPAYLVQSEAGNLALKLHSELLGYKKEESNSNKPKMFS